MPFDFAAAKRSARALVHSTLAVQAFYLDDSMSVEVECRVRAHLKVSKPIGDLYDGSGYANILDGADRVVFQTPTVDVLGVAFTPVKNGVIRFPTLVDVLDQTFTLDVREPTSGPGEEIWRISRTE